MSTSLQPSQPATPTPAPVPRTRNPAHAAARSGARVDTEAAARKRQEIGLSPRRATAQQAVARPPDANTLPNRSQWPLMAAVTAFALLLFALIATRLPAQAIGSGAGRAGSTAAPVAFEPIEEEFLGEESILVRDYQSRRWSMGAVEGVYRIRMWPGVVAWSTLGMPDLGRVRLATTVTVSPETPQGWGGLLARYTGDESLYMATVDGAGRFRFVVREGGEWVALLDWTALGALRPAGEPNELTLEDDGATVTVWANGEQIFATEAVDLPTGDAGVVAGSLEPAVAEANFDHLHVAPLE